MTASTVTMQACPDEPERAESSNPYFKRFELVARAQSIPGFREGLLAAYREMGRPDLVPALVEDLEWLDQFDPADPPSLLLPVTYGTVRRTPNGEVLDLTRPMVDREGDVWHWGGYTASGQPLVYLDGNLGYFSPIGEIWDEVGPFTQAETGTEGRS